MLSNQEKISILDQHLRALDHLLYNNELDLLQANAIKNKDKGLIDSINEKIVEINNKKDVLIKEKDALLLNKEL